MPPAIIIAAVAIGASAAAAAGIITATVAMVIVVGASVAGSMMAKKMPTIGSYASQQERKQVLRSATAPMVYIYGETVVSGLLFFAEEEQGDEEKEWVHLALAICGHEIEGVSQVWLGDDPIETYGPLAQYEIHNNRQTVDPFMLANCSSWKSDMIGKGITWARISLKFDAEKFPSGIPNIKFKLKGKKVRDPRNNQIAWSDTAALCILDFYLNYLKIKDSDINFDQFIQAANICEQGLDDGGGSRKRYALNGSFDASETQSGILDDLHKACAGEPTYMAGKHGMLAGAYYGPATMELTSGQIVSDVKVVPEAAYAQKLNTVTGTFLDPLTQYAEADYPAVQVQQYVDEDGNEFTDDLRLRFVSNEFQAQQLAQIKINRTRIGTILTFTMNMSGYKYRPGYYVYLTIEALGIIRQEFRITEWAMSASNGVDVTVKRETAAVWNDAIGQTIERPDITNFPTSDVAPPINLIYTPTIIGEVVQGVLSWSNLGQIQYNIVTIRLNGTPIMTLSIPGDSCVLTGLVRNSYTASVRAVNFMGQQSTEAFIIFNITAPPPPTSVGVEMGYFQATLTPKIAEIVNVSTQFDFWYSGETKLPNVSDSTVTANATRLGMGQQFTKSGLLADHTYYFYIRTINAFGTSAFIEKGFQYVYNTAGLIQLIDVEIKSSETYQNLVRQIDANTDAIVETALANDADIQRRRVVDGKNSAEFLSITTLIATNDSAYAQKFEQLTAIVGDNSAAVQQVSTAMADLNGKLSAQWGAKVQIDSQGKKYIAGIQLGVEGQGGDVQSLFLMSADTVAIYNPADGGQKLAFAARGGQIFLSEGIFDYTSITLAKLGSWYSANYVAGMTGTIMRADGSIEFNGGVSGQGRMQITNNRIDVYDQNGVLRVRLGQL